MSEIKNSLGMFGWASAAALVAFVASTHLVPHAFDALRPADRQGAPAAPIVDADVSARLWEDPFTALRRYDAERPARCEREKASRAVSTDCEPRVLEDRLPERLLSRLNRARNADLSDTLILIGLMPGADFVGGEEARRRVRYAVLAGLMAQGYVSDNPDRLGLLEFRELTSQADMAASAASASGAASVPASGVTPVPSVNSLEKTFRKLLSFLRPRKTTTFTAPYELLSRGRVLTAVSGRYGQVAVLWVDESALPGRKLDALARFTNALLGDEARAVIADAQAPSTAASAPIFTPPALAVIGPSSTDALRTAIVDLRCAAERATSASPTNDALCGIDAPSKLGDGALAGYRLLAKATFYNSASTAPQGALTELQDQKLETFVTDQFRRITADPLAPPVRMIRTIATDDEPVERLLNELRLRLPPDRPRRLVIVAERDSLYARGLVAEMQRRLGRGKQNLIVDEVNFFRGLDGAMLRDSSTDKPVRPASEESASRAPEWPEGRDQLDYLRRVSNALRESQARAGAVPIGAIGVFANDVHDKLMVLQALHEDFPDKPFFTTDLDARFLHPKAQDYTRNLIVAGSLPLAFPPDGASRAQTLQNGTPPLRDAYQTATYLAARHAGCAHDDCRATEMSALQAVLNDPSVYEIGRGLAVPLSGHAHTQRGATPALGNVAAAVAMGVLIVLGVIVWPSTPSLRRAREVFLRRAGGSCGATLDMNTVVLATLQLAVMAFVAASLIEFARPDEVNFVHMLWLGSLGGFAGMVAMLPALLAGPRQKFDSLPGRVNLMHAALLLGAVAVWAWMAWPNGRDAGAGCTECEPVTWLQGVSAWPSHLLHLLAVVVTVGAFDLAWSGSHDAMREDGRWLRIRETPVPQLRRVTLLRLMRYWLGHFSVLLWRRCDGFTCDVGRLWQEYTWRVHGQARALRILCWFLLTVGVVALVFFTMSGGEVPEIPVRGTQHRQMVGATLYALLLLVPLLIVAVADTTVMLLFFVRHLNAGRSWYPDTTLEKFSTSLGERRREQWLQRIAALPAERGCGICGPYQHTLLDPWIDVRLVARRSQHVARLVFWPFVVLALLVVARSRVFDNWSLTPAVATGVSLYVAMLIMLTLLLKHACEQTRMRALKAMRADLRWLEGSDPPLCELATPFQRLITEVETNQTGAFAPFLDQPLLKSLLVPLGGAGITQLFEFLLSGR
jgi:hypothetical protein